MSSGFIARPDEQLFKVGALDCSFVRIMLFLWQQSLNWKVQGRQHHVTLTLRNDLQVKMSSISQWPDKIVNYLTSDEPPPKKKNRLLISNCCRTDK